jgi:transposase
MALTDAPASAAQSNFDLLGSIPELAAAAPTGQGLRAAPAPTATAMGAARVLRPNRTQIELRASDLESLLPEAHRARVVWGFVERSDLSALYAAIKSREGGAGRTAIAPEILLTLWLYATLEGIGMARTLARLTAEHDAYRWICGGVQVNYHTLADFRVGLGETLDSLLTEGLVSLMAAGVVTLKAVAQDGMRVRASAGAGSFRRQEKLEQHLEQARARVAQLKRELAADPGALSRREASAQERAAREREARIEKALARLPELAQIKARQGKASEDARASMTDADATVMKMGDGGFRPAYNVQFATDSASQVIVGAGVVVVGTDQGQMSPMIEQVKARTGAHAEQWLVDGGYNKHEEIDAASKHTEVYSPVPQPKAAVAGKDQSKDQSKGKDNGSSKDDGAVDGSSGNASGDAGPRVAAQAAELTDLTQATQAPLVDRHQARPGDSRAVAAWRERMSTEEAKAIYKQRAASAECVNAHARNRGLRLLPVRGIAKVSCVVLLHAVAHNVMRMLALAPQLLGIGTASSGIGRIATATG